MDDSSSEFIWLAWFEHRRSQEIADEMGCEYYVIKASGPRGIKHIIASLKTVGVLIKNRNRVIFIQNPSRILAAIACFFKLFFRYVVIVDRHTNFRLGKGWTFDPREIFAILCSEFSLRVADLTIVTNDYLKKVVEMKGGRGFVLPDKIPDISTEEGGSSLGVTSIDFGDYSNVVVFICTYADDEPYNEVIQAASYLSSETCIVITGNYRKDSRLLHMDLPRNVILTGFVSKSDYEHLLFSADVVLDFTSLEWCLVCGGYEAMALGKPFITSDTKALREFFENSAMFSKHEPDDIAQAIQIALDRRDELRDKINQLSFKRNKEWQGQFRQLITTVHSIQS